MKPAAFLLFFLLSSPLHTVAGSHSDIDVVLFGDSNTWLGGDSCCNPKGWSKWFVEAFGPKSCVSYARSGATWTNTVKTKYDITEYAEVITDNNVIFNQINRFADAVGRHVQPVPGLIIVMAGTNDAWFDSRRPGVWNANFEMAFSDSIGIPEVSVCTSLASSVVLACKKLRKIAPAARIILATPMQTSRTDMSKISRTADIIAECGDKMDIMVVRLDKEGCVKAETEKKFQKFTYDGVHTNTEGARRIGYFLSQRITNGIF